ncbi:7TM diverse intracellular signaling domain-containing protein [Ekhidna sp.]
MSNRLFLLLLFTLALLDSSFSKVASIPSAPQGNVVNQILYFEDIGHEFTFETIAEEEFKILTNPKLGFDNGVYWFKVNLKHTKSMSPLIFDSKESTIRSIEIYQNGELIANNLDNVGLTNLAIQVEQTTKKEYLLKVDFGRQAYFPLQVYTKVEYDLNQKFYFFKTGWYYGFVCLVLVINLFFYFSFRDITFLWYSFFVLATNLGIATYDGVFDLFLKPDFGSYSDLLLHYLIPLFGAIFATSFLSLSIYLPKAKIGGIILLALSALFYLIFILTDVFFYTAIADTISLLVLLYYWAAGIYVLKTHDFARFFVIGYSLVLFSALFFVIPIDFGLNIFSVSVDHVKIGALFEMLILTYAISYRVKIMQEENHNIQLEIKAYTNQIYTLKERLEDKKDENSHNSLELKVAELSRQHALTDREAEVLMCVSKGNTHQKTAEELFISLNTVKYHTRNIYLKMHIKNKGEAIQKMMTVQ